MDIGGGEFQWWVYGFVADSDGGDRWDLEEGFTSRMVRFVVLVVGVDFVNEEERMHICLFWLLNVGIFLMIFYSF